MITPRYTCGLVLYLGTILTFGGQDGAKPRAEAERYILQTDSWESLPPMPEGSYLMNAVLHVTKIYMMGYCHRNLLTYNITSQSYTILPDIGSANAHKAVVLSSNRIYTFSDTGNANEIDCNTMERKEFKAAYSGWGIHGTPVEYQGKIYFTNIYADHVHVFDMKTQILSTTEVSLA